MNVQKIISPSGDRMVLLTEYDYLCLLDAADDRSDLEAVAKFRSNLASSEEELIPSSIVDRMLGGENLVRVWREYRGLSVKALAEAANIAPAYLSQLETGKREGTVKTLSSLAAALNVKMDDLVGV